MSDPLTPKQRYGAIHEELRPEGPGLFERFVLGMNDLLSPIGQNRQGIPTGRGGVPTPSLAEMASNARRLFDSEGEVSAMQYLGQYQGQLTEDQMRQLMAAMNEAKAQNPLGDPRELPLPDQLQALADSVGVAPNPNQPLSRIFDLINNIPTGAEDRQAAIDMYNKGGGVTPELMDFLRSRW